MRPMPNDTDPFSSHMSAELYLRTKALPLARTQHPFAFARTARGCEDERQTDISRRIGKNVRACW
jgi:hypothetical protein